jgi:hypothetical protein
LTRANTRVIEAPCIWQCEDRTASASGISAVFGKIDADVVARLGSELDDEVGLINGDVSRKLTRLDDDQVVYSSDPDIVRRTVEFLAAVESVVDVLDAAVIYMGRPRRRRAHQSHEQDAPHDPQSPRNRTAATVRSDSALPRHGDTPWASASRSARWPEKGETPEN